MCRLPCCMCTSLWPCHLSCSLHGTVDPRPLSVCSPIRILRAILPASRPSGCGQLMFCREQDNDRLLALYGLFGKRPVVELHGCNRGGRGYQGIPPDSSLSFPSSNDSSASVRADLD